MSAMQTTFRARYHAGETAKVAVEAAGAASVRAVVGASSFALAEGDDGTWTGMIPTVSLVGRVMWTVFVTDAEGCVTVPDGGSGSFVVTCAGRSPKRDVVDAIDKAIETWGTNPNRSLSVGEISITYKSLDELLSIRAQYVQRAEAEEMGAASSGGVRTVEVCF